MTYTRVIPRDLFNEASLLKCVGRLWIVLDETRDHNAAFEVEALPSFAIMQDEGSGAIFINNLPLFIRGRAFRLSRPLNSRAPWPLYLEPWEDDDGDEVQVFDDQGNLTDEMRAAIGAPGVDVWARQIVDCATNEGALYPAWRRLATARAHDGAWADALRPYVRQLIKEGRLEATYSAALVIKAAAGVRDYYLDHVAEERRTRVEPSPAGAAGPGRPISTDVLAVLSGSKCEAGVLFLPPAQLERGHYEAVRRVIEIAGGKWHTRLQGFVFEGEAADAVEPLLLTGRQVNRKQELGAFYTPPAIVRRVIEEACIAPGMSVLEPSAGKGALALAAIAAGGVVDAVEIDPTTARQLATMADRFSLRVSIGDFLGYDPGATYDRVVMNPPFAKQADVHHVMRALGYLRPGGRLVSVMSQSVTFRDTAIGREFRAIVEKMGGHFEPLPSGSFEASGTGVETVLLVLDKPA